MVIEEDGGMIRQSLCERREDVFKNSAKCIQSGEKPPAGQLV